MDPGLRGDHERLLSDWLSRAAEDSGSRDGFLAAIGAHTVKVRVALETPASEAEYQWLREALLDLKLLLGNEYRECLSSLGSRPTGPIPVSAPRWQEEAGYLPYLVEAAARGSLDLGDVLYNHLNRHPSATSKEHIARCLESVASAVGTGAVALQLTDALREMSDALERSGVFQFPINDALVEVPGATLGVDPGIGFVVRIGTSSARFFLASDRELPLSGSHLKEVLVDVAGEQRDDPLASMPITEIADLLELIGHEQEVAGAGEQRTVQATSEPR
jgi:hypothetical protein